MWLEKDLTAFLSKRTIEIDQNVANKWGFLLATIKEPVPVIDSLIAATAICYNLKLVTRNIKDFSKFPLEVLNPWV